MKIQSTGNQQNFKSQKSNNKPQSFGSYFDLKQPVIDEFLKDTSHSGDKIAKSARLFLAKFCEDIIKHNRTESNHFVYDDTKEIFKLRGWDGYYEPHVKNNEKHAFYSHSFRFIEDGKNSYKQIKNLADNMQDKIVEEKFADYNVNFNSNLEYLTSRLSKSLPNNKR